MITIRTIAAIVPSLATAYGKNGWPSFFRTEYSRRYDSFSALFKAWLLRSHFRSFEVLDHRVLLLGLDPRRCGRPELRDEVDVRADQRDDQAGHEQHVDRIEPRQRG